jgi:aspartate kinase
VALLVQKYGGSSVGSIDKIKGVAAKVAAAKRAGNDVIVVVSAMAGETNRLIALAQEISPIPDEREKDVLIATGEQVTVALLSLAIKEIGQPARSYLGHQVRIETDNAFGKARILSIDSTKIVQALSAGEVVVIAGFQGVDENDNITTLGRGGSDTSAVAVAAALKAERCDIYTDVDGVYTTDPRIVPRAKKLERVTYEEMLELASVGAKVLQTRSVELAMKEKVRVQVLSSFNDLPGTFVVDEDEVVEQQLITGVAYNRNEAKITVVEVPDRPGTVAALFGPLAEANVNVDMIVQNIAHDTGNTDVTFTVPRTDLPKSLDVLDKAKADIGFSRLITDDNVAKISVVGVGMRSHAGVAQTMFQALGSRGINILAITTSEIKVSVLIAEEYTELAVRVLHTAYGLDAA